MKRGIAISVVSGFVLVAIFGFLSMSHEAGHGHIGCIAAISSGEQCPGNGAGVLDFAIFHIAAFQNFSSAVLNQTSFSGAFIFFLLLLFAGFPAITLKDIFKLRSVFSFFQRRHSAVLFSSLEKLIAWLSLRENSPAVF